MGRCNLTAMLMAAAGACSGPTTHAVVATVRVEAIEPGVGVVQELEPGEPATILITVTWDTPSAQFAGMRGDTIVCGALGGISNIGSALYNPGGPNTFIHLGEPWAGSLLGTDIGIIPMFFTPTPHPWTFSHDGMQFIHFDWTAPLVASSTEVYFDFRPHAIAPNPRFYPDWGGTINSVEAETTYVGTSLTVLPAPSVACVLGLGAVWSTRRRRSTTLDLVTRPSPGMSAGGSQ